MIWAVANPPQPFSSQSLIHLLQWTNSQITFLLHFNPQILTFRKFFFFSNAIRPKKCSTLSLLINSANKKRQLIRGSGLSCLTVCRICPYAVSANLSVTVDTVESPCCIYHSIGPVENVACLMYHCNKPLIIIWFAPFIIIIIVIIIMVYIFPAYKGAYFSCSYVSLNKDKNFVIVVLSLKSLSFRPDMVLEWELLGRPTSHIA